MRCIVNSIRLNITLPAKLGRELDKLVKPREKSRFIAEALSQSIERIKRDRLHRLLEEGYKATKEEGKLLTREFKPTDLEGWDEY